jgi:beta-fructofuranosidase
MNSIEATLSRATRIHLWMRAADTARPGVIHLLKNSQLVDKWSVETTAGFCFCDGHVQEDGTYQLIFDESETNVSLIYSFNEQKVAQDGITVHWTSADNTLTNTTGYHFRPPFGWMNDPNGVCKAEGLYHLFYQHYPHRLRWNNMHWGHAVSKDMVNWVHQPIFLHPPGVLARTDDAMGGAYSGTVVPANGNLHVFFTDHFHRREPEVERQMRTTSQDGISAGPNTVIIDHRPDELDLTVDFRDPFVFRGADGRLRMLLGSQTGGVGTVLLYDTPDPLGETGWSFKRVLYTFDRFPRTTAECPCFVPLGVSPDIAGVRWALIVSLKQSRDLATRRKNLTIAVVGSFDGLEFTPEFEQEFDFGTDAYAFQAFVDDDGPRGIAWLANWTDINRKTDLETVMTLPRRLILDERALRTPPIEAVETLRRNTLADGPCAIGKTVAVPSGQAEIIYEFADAGAVFRIDFEHPTLELGLESDGHDLRLHFQPEGKEDVPQYIAVGARLSKIRVFLDVGSIEVFADDGRWTMTKRLPSFEPIRSLNLTAASTTVKRAHVWRLERSSGSGSGFQPEKGEALRYAARAGE